MSNPEITYGIFDKSINKKIIEQILSKGNQVFRLPELQAIKLDLSQDDTEILKNLNRFDWIIFTDVFAVESFVENLESIEIDLFELDALRVCAYGEAVADRLRFVQIHSDLIANKIEDKEIFKQINEYFLDMDEFIGLKVLFAKGDKRNYRITDLLESAQSDIVTIDLYKSADLENVSKLKTLVANGAFDEFIFCNVDEVFEFANIFYPEVLFEVLDGIEARAKDEMTYQTLKEFGLSPQYHA